MSLNDRKYQQRPSRLIAGGASRFGVRSQFAAAADNVTFVTDFGFNGRHAYYYVALEKGYYKAEAST